MPELLAPAGNLEKLKWALEYGADAVYFGLEFGSLRNFAGNFTLDQAEEGLRYLHARSKKGYVTLNIFPFSFFAAIFKPGSLRVFLPGVFPIPPPGKWCNEHESGFKPYTFRYCSGEGSVVSSGFVASSQPSTYLPIRASFRDKRLEGKVNIQDSIRPMLTDAVAQRKTTLAWIGT